MPLTHDEIADAYTQYAPALLRYLTRRLNDPEQAEDLLSDVFVRVLRHAERYEDRGYSLSAWLYRIADSRVKDVSRSARRHRMVELEPGDLRVTAPDEAVVRRVWCQELIAHARLNDSHVRLVALYFFADHSQAEVATAMGRSVAAVKQLRNWIIDRLRVAEADSASGWLCSESECFRPAMFGDLCWKHAAERELAKDEM